MRLPRLGEERGRAVRAPLPAPRRPRGTCALGADALPGEPGRPRRRRVQDRGDGSRRPGATARLSLVRRRECHAASWSPLCFLPLGGGVRSPDGRGETLFCSDSMAFFAWALSCGREAA